MATPKRKKMHPAYLGRLMFKYMRGELTPLQEIKLSAWRKLSEANEKFFQDATDPEKIRKGFQDVCKKIEWTKIGQIFPELPKLSKN